MVKLCYINIAFEIYGAVAQLARAIGSYPIGREFESLRRYHLEFLSNYNSSIFFAIKCKLIIKKKIKNKKCFK